MKGAKSYLLNVGHCRDNYQHHTKFIYFPEQR